MNESGPVHYTYKSFSPEDDLCQGDILELTESIRSVLESVHPHFLETKYTGFLVLTQTCDLVRHGNAQCKSRYINLAVIRPLEDVLWNFLDKTCQKVQIADEGIKGFYLLESKSKAHELLRRVVNQNEQALGVYYLHHDGTIGIVDPSVALLQVSIALRARQHYNTLVEARRGRLTDQFRDKLGWLIGNLFSRVATDDLPVDKQNEIFRKFLDYKEDRDYTPCWIPCENVELADKRDFNIHGLSRKEIADYLKQTKPEQPKEIAIKQALQVVQNVVGPLTDKDVKLIRARLSQDPLFSHACR